MGDFVRQLLRFLIIKTQQVYVLLSVNFLLFDLPVPGFTVWPGLRCAGGCGGVLLEGPGIQEGGGWGIKKYLKHCIVNFSTQHRLFVCQFDLFFL